MTPVIAGGRQPQVVLVTEKSDTVRSPEPAPLDVVVNAPSLKTTRML